MNRLYPVIAVLALMGAWLSTAPLVGGDEKEKGPPALSPQDYLKLLSNRFKDTPSYCPGPDGSSVRAVKEEDLAKLIGLLDSKEKCSATMLAGSAVYAAEGSTVGHEAAVLVDSFRLGKRYPIANTSTKHSVDPAALLKWWDARLKETK